MITLQEIKTTQQKLAEMIAAFIAQTKRTITFPEAEIELNDGEAYAGIILGKDGEPDYRLILLPGEAESVNWTAAKEFAAKIRGMLPTRREQALLYANLKEQFTDNYYWSGEQHAVNSDSAWCQYFDGGNQGNRRESAELRARAVRRLTIQ
jgi:hypothetical protein